MSGSKKKLNESALACQARNGDKAALQQLLQDNWLWLKGLMYNILGNIQDVDDALQEICLIVIDNIGSLREPERFKPWLAVVARNGALAYRQKRSKKPMQLDELLAQQQMSNSQELTEKVELNEQCERIIEALKELPEKYRDVFMLKYLKDMSYAEISEIMEITVTTVQIRLVRARRMIYNRLMHIPSDKVPRT